MQATHHKSRSICTRVDHSDQLIPCTRIHSLELERSSHFYSRQNKEHKATRIILLIRTFGRLKSTHNLVSPWGLSSDIDESWIETGQLQLGIVDTFKYTHDQVSHFITLLQLHRYHSRAKTTPKQGIVAEEIKKTGMTCPHEKTTNTVSGAFDMNIPFVFQGMYW